MSCHSIFAPAFKPTAITGHIQSPSSGYSKKRKRGLSATESGLNAEACDVRSSSNGPNVTKLSVKAQDYSFTTLTRPGSNGVDAAQCEVSGQDAREELPGNKFPHTSSYQVLDGSASRVYSSLPNELAGLRPPLCVNARSHLIGTNGNPITLGAKQQHIITLNTMMHKSLLEGDYVRANRAWSMLLRAELNGNSFDLRTNDRWTLGAEFILQRHVQSANLSNDVGEFVQSHAMSDHRPTSKYFHSFERFEEAKNYYERLILQYPYRKASPNTPDPQEFYLAMFGLWVFFIKEQHSRSIEDVKKDIINVSEAKACGSGRPPNQSASRVELQRLQRTEEIYRNTLKNALEIADRLKELIQSPPYSDNAKFRQFFDMMDTWIRDLTHATSSERDIEDIDSVNE